MAVWRGFTAGIPLQGKQKEVRSFPGNIYLQIEERFAEKIFIRYKLEEKAKRGISKCPNLDF